MADYGCSRPPRTRSGESLAALAALVPARGAVVLIEASPAAGSGNPAGGPAHLADGGRAPADAPEPAFRLRALTDADGPEMLRWPP